MATYTFVTNDTEEAGIADAASKAGNGASNAEYVESIFRSAVASWVSASSVTVTLSASQASALVGLLNDPKTTFDEAARGEVLRQVSPADPAP